MPLAGSPWPDRAIGDIRATMARAGDAAVSPSVVRYAPTPAHPRAHTKEIAMPFGTFLDSFPSLLFVAAHLMFMAVGVWAVRSLTSARSTFAPLLWLYVLTQLIFLGFFGGVITMKMAVLIEQTLLVIMIALIAARREADTGTSRALHP
jgi:hypothetical protein